MSVDETDRPRKPEGHVRDEHDQQQHRKLRREEGDHHFLPPPAEGLREFLLLMREAGLTDAQLRCMSAETPARLFKVGGDVSGTLRAKSSDSGAFGCNSTDRLDRRRTD